VSSYGKIYEILVGQKVFSDEGWHVYDANGVELSDPGGVLWRSSPGALLMWPKAEGLPEWDTTQGVAGKFKTAQYNRLIRDDELVADLIVTLVTQGFFNGNTQSLFCSR
jgi:hypothetical protein